MSHGRKYLSGLNDYGQILLEHLYLIGSFQVVFEADWNEAAQTIALRSDAGEEITVLFNEDDIIFWCHASGLAIYGLGRQPGH